MLHYHLNSCREWRGRWVPAQAAEGPKEGTHAELEAKILWKNKDSPRETHPKVEIVEVSLTPWTK